MSDLQGTRRVLVDGTIEYELTDPVILCRDVRRYGETNLGAAAMAKCLRSARAMLASSPSATPRAATG
eukprot:6301303-Prymnesium_polylepis.1